MSDDDRARWARTFTTVGWLFVLSYMAFTVGLIRRAFRVGDAGFSGGIWGQRIEIVSFLALPQNYMIFVPAAAAAVAATFVNRHVVDPRAIWLSQLIRVVAGVALVVLVVALVGILSLFARGPDPIGDFGAILGRIGGILMSLAIWRVCTEAEREAPPTD